MHNGHTIDLVQVDKVYHTRHILKKDPDTGRRRLYRKQTVHAAKQVEFGVQRGEIFGLLGPNGAGKTTIVKMISGLVRPTRGQVFVDGLYVEKKRRKVLRKVGVVLEGVRTSIWPLTPLENLAYFGNLKDVRGRVLKQRSRELLEFIGLKDKMNIQVRYLSRGEKQKLAVCIALIADPPVILLDEPTTGLDVQSSRAIKDKVVEMARNQGKCILVTTHDMHTAQELCHRIGIINHGELVACRRTEELLNVFSDQVYEFRLDRRPDMADIARIHGVNSVDLPSNTDEPVCLVGFDPDEAVRSEALYATMEYLRTRRFVIRSLMHRQASLETVFLRLTTSGAGKRSE